MPENKIIPLFWWSEPRLMGKQKENYGDLLSKYLIEKISGCSVQWVHPKKQAWYKLDKTNYLGAGSIIHHSTNQSIIWGSGIIDHQQKITKADYRAVRGPETRKYLMQLGFECPEVYGDPALLLPIFFMPQIQKKYKIGLIPHYNDYLEVAICYANVEDILVIDLMTNDVESVTEEILSCEKTISSSLHGLIISHAYRIPSVWVEFSKKIFGNGIKYSDYLKSVNLEVYKPEFLGKLKFREELDSMLENHPALPSLQILAKRQDELLKACPFK